MLNVRQNNRKTVVMLAICLFVVALFVIMTIQFKQVRAEDNNADTKSLINKLNDTVIKPNHGDVTFYLVAPIEGLNKLVVPDIRGEGLPSNYIQEIGDTYVCIGYAGGGVDGISCIPFTNIASVSYIK